MLKAAFVEATKYECSKQCAQVVTELLGPRWIVELSREDAPRWIVELSGEEAIGLKNGESKPPITL
jgi:hypothetical protein